MQLTKWSSNDAELLENLNENYGNHEEPTRDKEHDEDLGQRGRQ